MTELAGTGFDEHFGWADANHDGLIEAAECQEGRVTVLAAGPEPVVPSSSDLGERIHPTPAIGLDALFVRTDAALYCFGAKP